MRELELRAGETLLQTAPSIVLEKSLEDFQFTLLHSLCKVMEFLSLLDSCIGCGYSALLHLKPSCFLFFVFFLHFLGALSLVCFVCLFEVAFALSFMLFIISH